MHTYLYLILFMVPIIPFKRYTSQFWMLFLIVNSPPPIFKIGVLYYTYSYLCTVKQYNLANIIPQYLTVNSN